MMRSCPPYTLAAMLCMLVVVPLLATVARSTPYWGPAEVAHWSAQAERSTPPPASDARVLAGRVLTPRDEEEYLEMLGRIAGFLDVWQVHEPADSMFGGMREGEHMPNVIQTDNTSESIWVWTRYFEQTGDNRYYQNILDAFTYSMNYPAYLEEGGDTEIYGYYRMYNCGWAVRAELKFRDVYGDDTYKDYSDSCASYLRHHTLIRPGPGFFGYVNPPVLAWAMGNLYYAGVHENNAEWRAAAVQQTQEKVKVWVEEEPTLLADETWAMAGGATMWGLLNSFFCAYPESIDVWLPAYKDYMDAWATPGEHQNAWNGWYALGHWATGEALDDPFHFNVHLTLTDYLIAEDADEDGGIPTRPEDSDDMDQTWVSNYLAFMGCAPLLPPVAAVGGARGGGIAGLSLGVGPNPACSNLRLDFALARSTEVSVTIHDCAGRRIALLASGSYAAGRHDLSWCGQDGRGRLVASGAYFAVLQTCGGQLSRRILWVH